MKKKLLLLISFVLFTTFCIAQTTTSYIYGLNDAIAVGKSDTTTYKPPLRTLFFSATAGQTITVQMAEGGLGASQPITFTYGAAGTYLLPVTVTKVYSTGTDVTGIVGLRSYTGSVTYPTPTPTATFTPTATATATFTPTPTPTP